MLHKLIGWDFSFIFMKYGPAWREHRKFMYQRFNPRAATNFKPHVLKAIHSFMRNILASPENLRFHAHHFTIESMLSVTYGIQVQTGHNPVVELLQRVSDALVQASIPGRFLVDSFPFLQYVPSWIPFTQFKRDAKEWNKDLNRMIEEPFQITRNHFLAGEDTYSFVSDGLRAMKNVEDQPEQDVIKKVAGTLYFAASDTTFATIMTTILALMCHPEVMKKAQAEIDTIVEPGNLPDWKDQESLPYTSAVIKEILRWNPAIPLDLHYIECEDVYRGFTIPSNSIVLGNAWAILHEESVYPNPASFNPDRFIKNGKLNTEIRDPEDIAFGIGRRICPGRHLARPSVWMLIACIITLFDISKPVDEEGNVIEPKMEWTTGSISHPVPFQCRIVPRSEKAVAAIQATKGYEYAGISG
ncbi:hypothetical protein AX16_001488 [Volvariella volvacea WC 439]|nr:hypothetical protein AX16_001488 [Volvariella volvacea WC 439]